MDNEHVGASLIVSLSMASLIVTNVFSFSSTSYSSQPSDYIACSPVVLMTNLWLNLLDTHLLAPHLHILVVLFLVWMQYVTNLHLMKANRRMHLPDSSQKFTVILP